MRAHFLPDDRRIRLREGKTLLKSALDAGIPLSHSCGGVGRCSTCRVWVLEGETTLPARDATERATAERLGLEDRVRLSCRFVPQGDIKVRRLTLEDDAGTIGPDAQEKPGEERDLVVLFSDLRNFTPFAESLPPHDVIFILDRFFSQMGRVVTAHGGLIQNYMGDGFLALFGQDGDPSAPAKAVRAAWEMRAAREEFRVFLEANFDKSIRMGMGLHWGKAVIGTMGFGEGRRLAVIGDTVNTASRIESATKEAGVDILLSDDLYRKVRPLVEARAVLDIALKGKAGTYRLWALNGLTDTVSGDAGAQRQEAGRTWQRTVRRDAVLPGKPLPVTVGTEKRLLVLSAGELYAIEDRCPHMRLPLRGARITADGAVQCPWHHSAFDLRSGEVKAWAPWPPVVGPLLGSVRKRRVLRTWPVIVRDGYCWIGDRELSDAELNAGARDA